MACGNDSHDQVFVIRYNHYHLGKLFSAEVLSLRNPLRGVGSRMSVGLVWDMLRIQKLADVSRNWHVDFPFRFDDGGVRQASRKLHRFNPPQTLNETGALSFVKSCTGTILSGIVRTACFEKQYTHALLLLFLLPCIYAIPILASDLPKIGGSPRGRSPICGPTRGPQKPIKLKTTIIEING
jgi:hypothetical protein